MAESAFTSQSNKAMIWNLLYNEHVFANISSKKTLLVEKLIDDTVNTISSSHGTLLDKNKQAISKIITYLKNDPGLNNFHPVSANKKSVEQHQKEIDALANPTPPAKPNFADELDEPLGSEIDNILSAAISERETQVNEIRKVHKQDPNTAAFIEKYNNTPDANYSPEIKTTATASKKNISIGDSTVLPAGAVNIVPVSASDNNTTNSLHNASANNRVARAASSRRPGAAKEPPKSLDHIKSLKDEIFMIRKDIDDLRRKMVQFEENKT